MPDPTTSQPAAALPPGLVERARAYRESDEPPVPARDAATVVLVRNGAAGVEAYLLRRASTLAFAAGMYVFPGGSVDPRDGDAEVGWTGPVPTEWAQRFGCTEGVARALVCAAVRETFEESGVLLAGDPASGDVVADTSGDDWEGDRLALLDGAHSLSELLARRGLAVRADLLRAWTHWITPDFEPRRFDTRFFVAALPEGQRTRDVGGEADRVVWTEVGDAVRRCEAGELEMLPPTVTTLRDLAAYHSVDEVLAAGEQRDISPILPRPSWAGDDLALLLPGEEGYDEAGPDGRPAHPSEGGRR